MVHIGDDLTCDVMGARAAGISVIWVSNGRAVPDPEWLTAPVRTPRRLLDVGTGTGLVVEALLGRFDDIIANDNDNDADMLAAAEAALRPQVPAGTHLLLQEVAAEDFVPPPGWQADLVTICRAFHWLDQKTVLAQLDGQVSPDGAVAIFGDNSFWTATNEWKAAVRAIIQDFLGEQRPRNPPGLQRHGYVHRGQRVPDPDRTAMTRVNRWYGALSAVDIESLG